MKTLVSVIVSALVTWGGFALDTRSSTVKNFRPVNTKLRVVAPMAATELNKRVPGIANVQRSVQTLDEVNRDNETVYQL